MSNTTCPASDSEAVSSRQESSLVGRRVGSRDAAATRRIGLVYRAYRRSIDIVISSISLVVTLPLFLFVALVIKSTSRGPVFFSQTRIGRAGEPFVIVKFRTMLAGTHEEVLGDIAQRQRYVDNGFKLTEDDPRITPVGRWLRKTSLDELPQLVNVLSGQMSIVGVRPLVPDELAARSSSDQAAYGLLRPGLTGLWQIAGRSSLDVGNRIELDRRYLDTCSIRTDLRILALTPAALFRVSHAH
jgi:lipopolysaccharide/colanic/teichoic acid biosynthesis glycosyltransferase